MLSKTDRPMRETCSKQFANGSIHALMTHDGYPVEVTDTHLPTYTKNAVGRKQNLLNNKNLGDRTQRWMIGVSCMSGCPVRCRFCATGQLKRCRNLTAEEIVAQIDFVIAKYPNINPNESDEFKINYTRMGEPFLNIEEVKRAITLVDNKYPQTHHYLSTIGIYGSNFEWIKDRVTLQLSLHSLYEEKRNWLIPFKRKMSIADLGQVQTESNLKTTLNMTLVDESDFCIDKLKEAFNPDDFFVKLSPINPNDVSDSHNMGTGAVEGINLV